MCLYVRIMEIFLRSLYKVYRLLTLIVFYDMKKHYLPHILYVIGFSEAITVQTRVSQSSSGAHSVRY